MIISSLRPSCFPSVASMLRPLDGFQVDALLDHVPQRAISSESERYTAWTGYTDWAGTWEQMDRGRMVRETGNIDRERRQNK